MDYFKNLNIDSNSFSNASQVTEAAKEDERITHEKEAKETQRSQILIDQLNEIKNQNKKLEELQKEINEEKEKREIADLKTRRFNIVTTILSICIAVIALVVSIIIGVLT